GTVPGTPAQDITEVLFAEPFVPDGIPRLAVTMRVADLTAIPTNGIWKVYFKVGATTYFTAVRNDPVAGIVFEYGHSGMVDMTDGSADGGSTSVANKTLTVIVANSKVGNPTAGGTLTGIYGRTQTFAGVIVGGIGGGATPSHD